MSLHTCLRSKQSTRSHAASRAKVAVSQACYLVSEPIHCVVMLRLIRFTAVGTPTR